MVRSSVGRFISNDPIGQSGGLNLYLYGHDNPINNFDPNGLWGVQFGDMNLGIGNPHI